jgi:chromosomal replication initiator protein
MNALLDSGVQIVVTCDRFPKELDGLADRLKSRFSCGLTVGIDPPDLETRVAILMQKAALSSIELPQSVAFFIAERISGNVRELEGALKRLIANAFFTNEPITVPFAQSALRDLLQMHARLISIESIQKAVAKHFKIKISDITGMSRKQTLVMARQTAMYLIKVLTQHSLPEIGAAFGGRDHTTVLHAVRKIRHLIASESIPKQDIDTLMRMLS